MVTLLLRLLRLLPVLCGGHRQLALENLALRHQLAVYKKTVNRPKLRSSDRLFWVGLSRVWAGWRQALVIVSPNTVLRWQRRRFRDYWTNLSGRPRVGRPPLNAEIAALVKKNGRNESLVGRAPNPWRTHEARDRGGRADRLPADAEAAHTAVPGLADVPRQPCPGPRLHRLLHGPDPRLRVLFVLVVLAHHRRRVVHFNVTEHPTAHWTAQQLVEAFPNDTAPSHLLRDRDHVYGERFQHRVKGMRIDEVLTTPHSPWQNPFVERLIGSMRRECLDHIVVLGERLLRRILTAYFAYYHRARTHLSLDKDAPDVRPVEGPQAGRVVPLREVGGLHHRYVRRAA